MLKKSFRVGKDIELDKIDNYLRHFLHLNVTIFLYLRMIIGNGLNKILIKFYSFIENSAFFSKSELGLLKNKEFHKINLFYLNIIDIFAGFFHNVNKNTVNDLGFISYLYFLGIMGQDAQLDERDPGFFNYKISSCFIDEAMIRLTRFFPFGHPFWLDYMRIKKIFLDAQELERELSIKNSFIDYEQFREIAKGKTIISLLALLSLNHLNGEDVDICFFEDLLTEIQIGFQLIDDIDDFKEDLKNGQQTYVISSVYKLVNEKYFSDKENDLYKLFILSGLMSDFLLKAETIFRDCFDKVSEIKEMGILKSLLEKQIDTLQLRKRNINSVLEGFKKEVLL